MLAPAIQSRRAPIVATPAAVRGFESWAVAQLATSVDADDFRPEWPAEAYLPTPTEEAEERGYQVGLTGDRPGFNDVFAGDPAAATDGRGMAFTVGRNRGNLEHADRTGFEAGLDGRPNERPASVHRLMAATFAAAWARGAAERAGSEREMAAYFERLDFEAAEEERERDLEQLAREAGGWDRVAGRALI